MPRNIKTFDLLNRGVKSALHDDNFRADSVDRIAAFARPSFERLGGKLIVEHPAAAHDFPDAMREQAYRIIEESLRAGE